MRTLLIDDQQLFREGLIALLRVRDDVAIVGQASSAREAYDLVRGVRPDVVVMELLLPGADGLAAAREIRRLHPKCKLIVLTACKEGKRLQSAWLGGIDACVSKSDSAATLMAAFTCLAAGRRFMSPALRKTDPTLRTIDERYLDGPEPMAQLSLREREVFDLVVRGFSTKEVAKELCISIKTVETHRTHINEKLAAHCSADLVRYAFRYGVPPSSLVFSACDQSSPEYGVSRGQRAKMDKRRRPLRDRRL